MASASQGEAVPAAVKAYLDRVDEARRDVFRRVFAAVSDAMPAGYELGMHFGMPGWVVPLATFPATYNKKPLSYVSMAAQKSTLSLYLMGLYSLPGEDEAFRKRWEATGRALDMGKSCLRFKTADDVDLALIADAVASVPVERFLASYRRARG